ncbi:MAG: RDD family protein [Micrococcales bacterium]|nr:RDD family protein [Micrococcales bacterium]
MSVTDLEEEIPGLDAEGRPDPAYAASLGLVGARWGARSTAFVIDALLLAVLVSPLGFGVARWVGSAPSGQTVGPMTTTITVLLAVGGGFGLVCSTAQTAAHGRRGATLGKSILGLRSVDVAQFGRIGFGRALKRVLVLLASSVFFVVIGPYLLLISGVWDREGRGRSVLDRLARCWVVDTRDGIDPFDARALRRARRALNVEAVDTEEDLLNLATGSSYVSLQARSKAGVIGAGGVGSTWEEMSGKPGAASARSARPAVTTPVRAGAPHAVAASAAPGSARTAVTAPAASAPVQAPAVQAPAVPLPTAPVGASTAAVRPGSAEPRPLPAAAARPSGDRPGGQAQPSAASGLGLTLVFDSGERFSVERFALIGCAPQPQPGDPQGCLVVVDDPTGQLAQTHAEIRPARGAWWIADRGSSTGTTICDPDGRTVVLAPGQHEPLRQGTRVRLGGRTLEVRRGAP